MANIVITGANRGIGLALTKQLSQRGDKVWAACRHSSTELDKTGASIIESVNMAEPTTYDVIKNMFSKQKIDLLINNAGVLGTETLTDMDANRIMYQFQVNSLAPILLTQTLLPCLAENARVAMITSRMGSMTDNASGGYYGYRMSKAALNAGSVSLAKDLKELGIAVGILHPGFVQTDMVGGAGDVSTETAAQQLISRIDELNLQNSGHFQHANGEMLPW